MLSMRVGPNCGHNERIEHYCTRNMPLVKSGVCESGVESGNQFSALCQHPAVSEYRERAGSTREYEECEDLRETTTRRHEAAKNRPS